jgi:hypothetical protein
VQLLVKTADPDFVRPHLTDAAWRSQIRGLGLEDASLGQTMVNDTLISDNEMATADANSTEARSSTVLGQLGLWVSNVAGLAAPEEGPAHAPRAAQAAVYGTDLATEFCNLLFYLAEYQHEDEAKLEEVVRKFRAQHRAMSALSVTGGQRVDGQGQEDANVHIAEADSAGSSWMVNTYGQDPGHICSTGTVAAVWSLLICDHVDAYGYGGCPTEQVLPALPQHLKDREHYFSTAAEEHARVAEQRYRAGQSALLTALSNSGLVTCA